MSATAATNRTAADVCAHFALQDKAARALDQQVDTKDFLRQLVEQRLYVDAIRFLGQFLPARKAVWWACTCVRHVGDDLPPPQRAALAAAVHWVLEPTAERSQAAKDAMKDADDTPAGAAALAAAKALTRPVSAGKAAAGAVFMAAGRVQGEGLAQAYGRFLAIGLVVEQSPTPWQQAPAE